MHASLCALVASLLLCNGPAQAASATDEEILSLVQMTLKQVELGHVSGSATTESEEQSSHVSLHASHHSPLQHSSGVWELVSRTLAGMATVQEVATMSPIPDWTFTPRLLQERSETRARIEKFAGPPVGFVSIQTKEVQEKRRFGSFLSKGGYLCAEGDLQSVKMALAHRKASVQGSLYRESQVSNQTCADRGCDLKGGTDRCFPGLQTYFREREDHTAFIKEESKALSAFQAKHKLSVHQAGLMAACMCHPDSTAMSLIGHHCEGLQSFQ